MARQDFVIEKRIPLALVLTLCLQVAAAIWWTSAKDTEDHFRDRRLAQVEQHLSRETDRQMQILERLARLEAQGEAIASGVKRLEVRMIKPVR